MEYKIRMNGRNCLDFFEFDSLKGIELEEQLLIVTFFDW